MNVRDGRRGVTLVELTIVVVLAAIVLGSIYQILVANQRTYTLQNRQVNDRQTLRAGLELLASELRELSPGDGDIVDMDAASIRIRASRGLGLVCEVLAGGMQPVVRTRRMGSFLRGDSARVFYENHPARVADDDWRTAVVEVRDSTGTVSCPGGSTAQEIRLRGIRWGTPPDSFTTGAPIRSFIHYRYFLEDYGSETYLTREDPDGDVHPVAGPLDPTDGLEFRFLDGDGNPTTAPTDVQEIGVTLRTPGRPGNGGGEVQDSLATQVYTRNTG